MMTVEHSEFLMALRDSGVVNMYGAAPYLQEAFELSRKDSHTILAEWMKSFNEMR